MLKSSLAMLAGAAALVAAAPALGKPGGGSGGGPHSGPPATSQGPTHSSPNSPASTTTTTPTTDTTTSDPATSNRDQGRMNSQGPSNAAPTGISNANENSVLAGGSVSADTLPGLTTGLSVRSSTGSDIGKLSEVVTGRDGSIRMVVVTTPTGQTIRLPANSLSITGDVVTTTSTIPNP
jgi:hypothetical protein